MHCSQLPTQTRTLYKLHRIWTRQYVFNNLNALINGTPDLSPTGILRNLQRYRGGYCHELNLNFARVLRTHDLASETLLARVLYGTKGQPLPASHSVLRVTLDGRDYLCDTGFGLGLLWPVRLDAVDTPQRQHSLVFRVSDDDSGRLLQLKEQGRWSSLYQLPEKPADRAAIEMANRFSAQSPSSMFSANLVVTHYRHGGRRLLLNDHYQDRAIGLSVRLDSASMLSSCLSSAFGINLTRIDAEQAFRTAKRCN